jgi:hypothetical protein
LREFDNHEKLQKPLRAFFIVSKHAIGVKDLPQRHREHEGFKGSKFMVISVVLYSCTLAIRSGFLCELCVLGVSVVMSRFLTDYLPGQVHS